MISSDKIPAGHPAREDLLSGGGQATAGAAGTADAGSPLPLAGALRARHAALSEAQVSFLDFAARVPECLRPESYPALQVRDEVMESPVQPWPLFIGPGKRAEMARAGVGVCNLLRDIPHRVFADDPQRLAEYYALDPAAAQLISSALHQSGGMSHAVARGDFLETASGFKCCEFNIAGNLGGWHVARVAAEQLSTPVVRRFLDEHGLTVTWDDPLRGLFAHIVDDALGRGLASEGRLDLAFTCEPGKEPAEMLRRYMDEQYRAVLAEKAPELAGAVTACLGNALDAGDGMLRLGGRRIHLVIDMDPMITYRPVFVALMANTARVFNGPASLTVSDKLNLALLSELQDSEIFDAAERETIRAHVPWTRRVADDFVDYAGERAYLPDLLEAERDRLVLKAGLGWHGSEVHSGRLTAPARWQELVRTALEGGGWVVQERLEPLSYVFQMPGGGAGLHDVVWGLFVFGKHFGGGWLRVSPSGRDDVVNCARGARVSICFGVER
jgi:hypothetical protein